VIIAGAASIDKSTVVTGGKSYFRRHSGGGESGSEGGCGEAKVRNKP